MYAFFFFKQKTAYERRISDWSSDVCASDLAGAAHHRVIGFAPVGTECADEVEMLAGLQPVAADQRLLRQRGAGDDEGAACGGFQIVGPVDRSEESRGGQECVRTMKYRMSPSHYKKQNKIKQ